MNVEDWLAKSRSVCMSDSSISEWLHPSRRESNTSDSGLPSPSTLVDNLSPSTPPCPRVPETGCLTGWLNNVPGLQIVSQSFDTHISDDDDSLLDEFSGLQIAATPSASQSTWLSTSPMKENCSLQPSRYN